MFSQLWIMLRKLREFRRNQRLTRPQFDAMQLRKFRKLVEHANQHSPYYARLIKERHIDFASCVPSDFPVLTKSLLMTNFDGIVTDRRITRHRLAEFLTRSANPNELFAGEFQVLHTSGSSGEVGYFVYSRADWSRGMAQGGRQRSERFTRKRKGRGKFRIAFYGAVGGHFAGVSMAASALRGPGRYFVRLGLFEVNSPLPQIIEQLNKFQPEVLIGYTTALKMLADQQRAGILHITPLAIGTGGEAMTLADKQVLESAFNCAAGSGYGCTEHLMMGASDPDGSTMTLYDDDLIFELADDHCLITNLFNFTLPLIRYRMSDVLRPVPDANASSPYRRIHSLVGRSERMPMFTNRDGVADFLSPHTINEIFVAGVTRFQLHILGHMRFEFRICLDSSLDPQQRLSAIAAVKARLQAILAQKLMDNVRFDVVVVADLPLNPRTRKFELIVDASGGQSGQ